MAVGGVGIPSGSSASCSMNAEKRICRPAVPLSEATLPASVLMSYFGAAARDGRAATKAIAAAALMRVSAPAKRKQLARAAIRVAVFVVFMRCLSFRGYLCERNHRSRVTRREAGQVELFLRRLTDLARRKPI